MFQYSIQLRNNPGECKRLYDFIEQALDRLSLSKQTLNEFKLVAEESFSNIVRHAYSEQSQDEKVDIEITATDNKVSMTFRDKGVAFNPMTKENNSGERDFSTGGMGLLLIKELTNEQKYQRLDDSNVFTVTKTINP